MTSVEGAAAGAGSSSWAGDGRARSDGAARRPSATDEARRYFVAVFSRRGSASRMKKTFFALDAEEVLAEIREAGFTPISIKERRLSGIDRQFVLNANRLAFLRAMLSYARAGMTPTICLQRAIDLTENIKLRAQIQPASEILRRGGGFLEAVQALRMFDRASVAFLDASARGGRLQLTLPGLIDHLEHKARITKEVSGRLSVVMIEFVMAFLSVIAMEVAGFDAVTAFGGATTPEGIAALDSAVATARAINWVLILLAVVPACLGAALFLAGLSNDDRAQDWAGRTYARIPFLRDLFLAIGVTETFSIVARMVESGVRLQDAIRTAVFSTTFPPLRRYWERVHRQVDNGAMVATAFSDPLLSEPENHTIRALATRDQLVETLDQIAGQRRDGAVAAGRRLAAAGFVVVVGYILASVFAMIYVVMAQNSALMDGFSAVTG